eukprot:CAMPEP_0197860836 /NCGR_PEP_ID=MMETSP1438-20131217/36483_1 /TAXON_ID=1461541 /ORGANISM="Pterosperma sp., Strain CCMP1384" /LENGTH=252 /DNA_ID=CAMNT_0043477827 /DNA_START=124 /DNA_END=882 /DNA_ORIENTATION=+
MGNKQGKDDTIRSVLIVIAMEAEAQNFIDHLKLTKDDPKLLPPQAHGISYSGTSGELKVHVVCNGKCPSHGVDNVGTVPAALTTFTALQVFKPDFLINAGTAGGFKARGGAVGDVYISSTLVNHDRRIPIPGFDKYGVGIERAVPVNGMHTTLGLKVGIVTTGNSLDCSPHDKEMIDTNGGDVKDMEGAAIAYTANLFGTPFLAVKAVTDIVDGDRATADEFTENLAAAAAALKEKLPQVIEYIAGKRVDAL